MLLTYLPFLTFWRSTLIDLGPLEKTLCWHQNYPPPPRYAYFRAYLKKYYGGPPSQIFAPPPFPKVCPPCKNSCGRPCYSINYLSYQQDKYYKIWTFLKKICIFFQNFLNTPQNLSIEICVQFFFLFVFTLKLL